MENKHKIEDLYQMQSLPLHAKINMTKYRINQWVDEFGEDGVYISFSGGKDSTVLMEIVRNECGYKNIQAVFVDVPTQYPELRSFAKTWENLVIIRPQISFIDVCENYGFPLISKEVSLKVARVRKNPTTSKYLKYFDGSQKGKSFYDHTKYNYLLNAPFNISYKCCDIMKHQPIYKYEKETKRKPITAQMANESRLRRQKWIQNGCNAFDIKNPISNPMSFWTEQDVLEYIKTRNLPICSVYGEIVEDTKAMGQISGQMKLWEERPIYKTTGCKRTGCMLCGFGCHLEKPGEGRFELLKQTHPKMYGLLDVVKNNGVTFREAIEWLNENGNTNIII